jgi:hypothetical protein
MFPRWITRAFRWVEHAVGRLGPVTLLVCVFVIGMAYSLALSRTPLAWVRLTMDNGVLQRLQTVGWVRQVADELAAFTRAGSGFLGVCCWLIAGLIRVCLIPVIILTTLLFDPTRSRFACTFVAAALVPLLLVSLLLTQTSSSSSLMPSLIPAALWDVTAGSPSVPLCVVGAASAALTVVGALAASARWPEQVAWALGGTPVWALVTGACLALAAGTTVTVVDREGTAYADADADARVRRAARDALLFNCMLAAAAAVLCVCFLPLINRGAAARDRLKQKEA